MPVEVIIFFLGSSFFSSIIGTLSTNSSFPCSSTFVSLISSIATFFSSTGFSCSIDFGVSGGISFFSGGASGLNDSLTASLSVIGAYFQFFNLQLA